jgi:hypothetical protein
MTTFESKLKRPHKIKSLFSPSEIKFNGFDIRYFEKLFIWGMNVFQFSQIIARLQITKNNFAITMMRVRVDYTCCAFYVYYGHCGSCLDVT